MQDLAYRILRRLNTKLKCYGNVEISRVRRFSFVDTFRQKNGEHETLDTLLITALDSPRSPPGTNILILILSFKRCAPVTAADIQNGGLKGFKYLKGPTHR